MTSEFDISVSNMPRRAARGAIAGAALGAVFLAVGLVRGATYLVSGGHIAQLSQSDGRVMAYYAGGFTIAGTLLGAAWPLFRGRDYLALALGGAVVGAAIVLGKAGTAPPKMSQWIIGIGVGAGIGWAAGWRNPSP